MNAAAQTTEVTPVRPAQLELFRVRTIPRITIDYARPHPDLYHGADTRTPVTELIELGDDERIATGMEGTR